MTDRLILYLLFAVSIFSLSQWVNIDERDRLDGVNRACAAYNKAQLQQYTGKEIKICTVETTAAEPHKNPSSPRPRRRGRTSIGADFWQDVSVSQAPWTVKTGDIPGTVPGTTSGHVAVDSLQNILSCRPYTDPCTGQVATPGQYKLLVERKSDGQHVSLDFCAAAEDGHYATDGNDKAGVTGTFWHPPVE